MAPINVYSGRARMTRVAKNHAAWMVPVVADATLKVGTVAEVLAGQAIECSIKKIGVTGDTSMESDQYLCDEYETETAGPIKYSLDAIEILAGDPQQADPFIEGLTAGETVYLIERRGIEHSTEPAAGQRISIAKLEVALVEWVEAEANTSDKYRYRLHFAVAGYEPFATIVA